MGYINYFIDALKYTTGLFDIYNVSVRDLPTVVNIEFNGDNYEYITKPNEILNEIYELEKPERTQIGKMQTTWDEYPEIYTIDRFLVSAKTHFYREDFIFAIVELQTSFEAFIRSSHKYIMIKNGLPQSKINKLSEIAFRNIIEQHLAKSLKVDLSFNKVGPIKDWYEKLYKIRNEVVHLGRTFITGNDMKEAFEAYYAARNYISDCMKSKGYLSSAGNIDLKAFRQFDSLTVNIDHEEVTKRLFEKGLLPKGKDIKKE